LFWELSDDLFTEFFENEKTKETKGITFDDLKSVVKSQDAMSLLDLTIANPHYLQNNSMINAIKCRNTELSCI
jgi:hypothetical protein